MAIGGVAAVIAAVLAFLDAAWSRALLAAELALLVVGAYVLLSRKIERVRSAVAPLNARGRQVEKQIRSTNDEISRVRHSIAKLRAAHNDKIALAVQRIDEKLKAQLSIEAAGIKSVIKDTEIESGLAALNRYTALAEQESEPEEPASGA